jgi:hypothetical protein
MPSFFDDDSDDELPSHGPHQQQPQAGPGPSSLSSFSNNNSNSNRYSPDPYAGDYHSPPPPPLAAGAGNRRDVSMSSFDPAAGSYPLGRGDDGDDPMGDDGDGDDSPYGEIGKLMKAWVAERSCPSFLRYEEDLVENVIYRVSQQVRTPTTVSSLYSPFPIHSGKRKMDLS